MAPKTMSKIGNSPAFTLAEMLVVMMIVSILLTMGSVFWRSSNQRAALKGALQGVISILNYARGQAVTSDEEVSVVLDGKCFSLFASQEDSDEKQELDKSFCCSRAIDLEVLPSDEIVFLPSGVVEEKTEISLKDKLGRVKKISISSLTGKISISS